MSKNMFLICLFFLTPLTVTVAAAAADKYGVFVGVSKYTQKLKSLPSSVNDAAEMCKAFSSNCAGDNTILLQDESATRAKIIQSIRRFQVKAGKNDLFVFYYSGHGTLFPDCYSEELDEAITLRSLAKKCDKSDAALVPFDSAKNDDGKKWRNLILDDELYRLFAEFTKKGARVVFISDSCYSGGQAKSLSTLSSRKFDESRPIKFMDWREAIGITHERDLQTGILEQREFKSDASLSDMYIMVSSSEEDEISLSINPRTGTKMSLFTYYFLLFFNDYKQSGKVFTFETINNEVKKKVAAYAESNDEVQNPRVNTDFYNKDLNIPVF